MEEKCEKVIKEIEEIDDEFTEALAKYEVEKGREQLMHFIEHIQYLESQIPISGKSLRGILSFILL